VDDSYHSARPFDKVEINQVMKDILVAITIWNWHVQFT
jgi:hypothetical protein